MIVEISQIRFLPIPRRMVSLGGEVTVQALKKALVRSSASAGVSGSYRIIATPKAVEITAADAAGGFYAQKTIAQIVRQLGPDGVVSGFEIDDRPEFACRGLSLDVSRDRVPTMEELKSYIDLLATWKINHLQLYVEHTFAYRDHEVVWRDASPFTADEIRELDAFCRERFIELVPMQNSLGHLLRWLCHEPYRRLAECPNGFHTGWSMSDSDPFSLCPTDERSLEFIESLLDELLPNFSSTLFSGGCDETADIGLGGSREACEKVGRGRVYLDYVRRLNDLVNRKYGRRLMIYGDIIKLHPELFADFPRNILVEEWGYGADYPFRENGRRLAEAGIEFCFLTSDSGYSSCSGRTYRWLANIRNAAFAGMKTGAHGLINTEWGDNGHWNTWSSALPGMVYAAAMGWAPRENEKIDIGALLDDFIYVPGSGAGDLLVDLGRVYSHISAVDNSDVLYQLIHKGSLTREEPLLANFSAAGLDEIGRDLESLGHRLDRLPELAPRLRDELEVMLEFHRFALHCGLLYEQSTAPTVRELPAAAKAELAPQFAALIRRMVEIRDRRFRPGGREAAIFWLRRWWDNVCGEAHAFPAL